LETAQNIELHILSLEEAVGSCEKSCKNLP